MTRGVRITAMLLLAGVAVVALPREVLAENTRWSHSEGFDGKSQQSVAYASSLQKKGDDFDGSLVFRCVGTDLASNFRASVKVREVDFYPAEKNEVFWRIDSGAEPKTVWQRGDGEWGGLHLVGPRALELAFEMLRAREQVQITTDHGSIVNDLTNYKDALARMLKHCVVPYVKAF